MINSHKKVQKYFHSTHHDKRTKDNVYKKDLIWDIGHFPRPENTAILRLFFRKFNSKFFKEYRKTFQCRFYLKDGTSLHVILHKKSFGFAVNVHIDVEIHGEVEYNKFTFRFLLKLMDFLKKVYGHTYLKAICI